MATVGLALMACSLIGMSCDTSKPDVAIIQSAYEQEASSGSKLHDRGLRVLEASCEHGKASDNFLCQVTFLSNDDPRQQLSF